MTIIKKYLREIKFSELLLWDVKRLFISDVKSKYQIVNLNEIIKERSEKIKLFEHPKERFGILGVNNKEGIFDAYTEEGEKINQAYKKVYNGDLAYNPYRVNVGSVGLKTQNQKNNFISPAYVVFTPKKEKLLPDFLYKIFQTKTFNKIINDNTTGSVRQNLKYDTLKEIKIPLPPLSEQNKIVKSYNQKITEAENAEKKAKKLEKSIEEYLMEELGIEKQEKQEKKKGLQEVRFKDILEWGFEKIVGLNNFKSNKYQIFNLEKNSDLFLEIKRGKSPKYSEKSQNFILNQKCNRWNEIDLSFIKKVDDQWFSKINGDFLTKEGDILINSTGEGTIGRASEIKKDFEGLLFDSHLLLLRLNKNRVNTNFYTLFFNSDLGQKQVELIKSAQATKQTELGVTNLQKISFPLPPLSIQQKIVEKISGIKEEIKSLKKFAEENSKLATQEFEGEIFSE